jgi:metallo-beta-lactamase family protein
MSDIKIKFAGGAESVTGANFFVDTGKTKFVVDCGLEQGSMMAEKVNWEPFSYDPKTLDFAIITHAHIDHIGRLPKLVYDGFDGKIFGTPATVEITKVMLEDTSHILSQSKTGKEFNLGDIYSEQIVGKVARLWEGVGYHKKTRLSEDVEIEFFDAGHVLGSVSVMVTIGEGEKKTKILFTGDLGNSPSPILRDSEIATGADYIVMESVYGDRNHEGRDQRREILKKALLDTKKDKKVLMVPIFSLERTQEFLHEMNDLFESGQVPKMDVYLDSPLALKITDIFYNHKKLLNEHIQDELKSGDDVFMFKGLHKTMETRESKSILKKPVPKVILAGAGMSTGGRILHHEKAYLGDPNNLLLITGYQTPNGLGREIQDGAKKITIMDEEVIVRAEVRTVKGYSGHKDSDNLLDYVEKSGEGVKRIFVTMGERKASMHLAQKIKDNLGIDVLVPQKDEEVYL